MSSNLPYRLKHLNSDFRVSEVSKMPNLCNIEAAKFTIAEMRKDNINPFDAVQIIASALGVHPDDITYSGMKDRSGVTSQLMAISGIFDQGALDSVRAKSGKNITLTGKGYSREPMRIGKLHGNNFSIVLRDIDRDHQGALNEISNRTIESPTVNYYDNQRFGLRGILNTHLIGDHIYEGDWDGAVEEFLRSGNPQAEKGEMMRLIRAGASSKDAFRQAQDPRRIAFFLGASSSYNWNEEAKELLKRQQRPSNLTEFDNDLETLLFLNDPNAIRSGSRNHPYFYYTTDDGRNFREYSSQRQVIRNNEIHVSNVGEDEEFRGKLKAQLDFFLGGGSYATMAVKQFMDRTLDPEIGGRK